MASARNQSSIQRCNPEVSQLSFYATLPWELPNCLIPRKCLQCRDTLSHLLACPKTYDLCAPNPLSRNASSSDIYPTGGRFVGNQLRRFVSPSRCWVRSPPPYQLSHSLQRTCDLRDAAKGSNKQRMASAVSAKHSRHGWRADKSPYALALPNYCSFAYSVLACLKRGRVGSASFQRFRSGASVSRAFCLSPREE
jgi:hypothetical protein